MTRPWLAVLCLSSAIACSACVPTQLSAKREPDVLHHRVHTWLGMPRDFLEKYWGIAKKTQDMGMGLRYLTYRANGKNACSVVFIIDITNTVKGGEWKGDRSSCLRFVKQVPTSLRRQELVLNSL
jgi:hypothetical protein